MRDLCLIAHNLRSTHNVGSLLRTADGLGVQRVFLTGYTPYPNRQPDDRLPHIAAKLDAQIHKTALGAENTVDWQHNPGIESVLDQLHTEGYTIVALEQTKQSLTLSDSNLPEKVAILVGREVEGIEPEIVAACDAAVEIPMFGTKESFNVVQAAAMALYELRFH